MLRERVGYTYTLPARNINESLLVRILNDPRKLLDTGLMCGAAVALGVFHKSPVNLFHALTFGVRAARIGAVALGVFHFMPRFAARSALSSFGKAFNIIPLKFRYS